MSDQLDALTAQVAATLSVEHSAVVLIDGIAARIGAAGTDPAALSKLQSDLSVSAAALAAAVAANTPPATVAVPVAVPVAAPAPDAPL